MAEKKTTGRLEGWYTVLYFGDLYQIQGNIYDDVKQRFHDGAFIHTSCINQLVTPIESLKEGMVVHTTYSKYLLGKPFSAELVK